MMSSMLITTAVLLTLMFVILSEIDSSLLVFAKDNTPGTSIIDVSSDATASEAPYLLPDFVGSYLDSVKSKEDFQKKYFLTETEEYNDEQPAGVIFEQNPIANTPVTDSVNVAVKVSKGPAPIPDTIVGMAQADAQKTLDDLKIKYQVVQMYDDTVPAGNVIKVTRLPGEVMLFISQGSMNGASTGSGGYGGMTFEEYWKIFGTNSN